MGLMKTERQHPTSRPQHKHKTLLREVELNVRSTLRKAASLEKQLTSLVKRTARATTLLKKYRHRIDSNTPHAKPTAATECAPAETTIRRPKLNPKRHRQVDSNATMAAPCEPPMQTNLPPKSKAKRPRLTNSSEGHAQPPATLHSKLKPKRKLHDAPVVDVEGSSTVDVCSALSLQQ
jgi:hypothetical protein